jgi:hypothetical protein
MRLRRLAVYFRDGDHVCVTGTPAMGFCMQGTQLELLTMEGCR